MQPDQTLLRKCADYVDLTESEVLAIAATAPLRYKVYEIDKRVGSEKRVIAQPARELKSLQYFFLHEVLRGLPVSECATAYILGGSIRKNAATHEKSRVIFKMDFEAFFPSIKASDWLGYVSGNLQGWTVADALLSERILFFGQKTNTPKCLAIGAPTSPSISNLMMYQFDLKVSAYCKARKIRYTRYADDMTFSSDSFLNTSALKQFIRRTCKAYVQIKGLRINHKKTVLISKAFSRRVTGLVITNEGAVSIGRDRKRLISAIVHKASLGQLKKEDASRIQGWLGFVLDVEPSFGRTLRRKYGRKVVSNLMRGP